MTPEERRTMLLAAAPLICGPDWQHDIARKLGPMQPAGPHPSIDDLLVRRWCSGERDIPEWVPGALRQLAREASLEVRQRLSGLEVITESTQADPIPHAELADEDIDPDVILDLDQVVSIARQRLVAFEAGYRVSAEEKPKRYPLQKRWMQWEIDLMNEVLS